MNDEFLKYGSDLITLLIEYDIINEHSLRDYRVRKRYNILIEEGYFAKQAREVIADEFHIGIKTIEYILYLKK